ncbi:hypothetical protein CFP56_039285 [Quercus suber]|uniref:Uncharacterized protein n=1 Tax=Quercus suber TaxID=58331 RepID=A0AAW0IZE3_QUESU
MAVRLLLLGMTLIQST